MKDIMRPLWKLVPTQWQFVVSSLNSHILALMPFVMSKKWRYKLYVLKSLSICLMLLIALFCSCFLLFYIILLFVFHCVFKKFLFRRILPHQTLINKTWKSNKKQSKCYSQRISVSHQLILWDHNHTSCVQKTEAIWRQYESPLTNDQLRHPFFCSLLYLKSYCLFCLYEFPVF